MTISKETSQLPDNERFRQTHTTRKSEVYLVAHAARLIWSSDELVVVPPRAKGARNLLITELFAVAVVAMG